MPGVFDRLRAFFRPAASGEPNAPVFTYVDDSEWSERLATVDATSVQVYADWLEEHGDSRAQLLRLANTPAFDPFLQTHARQLFGPFAEYVTERYAPGFRPQLALRWGHGVLHTVALRNERCVDQLNDLLALPLCTHVSHVSVGPLRPGTDPADTVRDFSALASLRNLRTLFLGDFEYPDECEMSWAENGQLGELWPALPRLRELKVRGRVSDWGAIDAPQLTELVWETSGHTRANLQSLLEAKLPAVEHLELWFGDENYGAEVTVDDLRPLLEKPFPRLRSLGLKNFEFTDGLIAPLLASPLLPQLRALDLSLGVLSDEGADELLRGRAKVAHLALNLSQNALSPRHLGELEALNGAVNVEGQRLEEFDEFRYVAVGE